MLVIINYIVLKRSLNNPGNYKYKYMMYNLNCIKILGNTLFLNLLTFQGGTGSNNHTP